NGRWVILQALVSNKKWVFSERIFLRFVQEDTTEKDEALLDRLYHFRFGTKVDNCAKVTNCRRRYIDTNLVVEVTFDDYGYLRSSPLSLFLIRRVKDLASCVYYRILYTNFILQRYLPAYYHKCGKKIIKQILSFL